MQIGPIVIMKSSEWPFYREIARQINERPELRVAIEKGVAHVAINPRWRERCLSKAGLITLQKKLLAEGTLHPAEEAGATRYHCPECSSWHPLGMDCPSRMAG